MIVMGIDASYTRTGISLVEDGKIIVIKSLKFKKCKNKQDKRANIKRTMEKLLNKYDVDYIIVERTRQFSTQGKAFIAMNQIKSGVSLQTVIIDTAYEYDKEVYSVDTRSWKSKVIGTSKPDSSGNKKAPTIKFIQELLEKQGSDIQVYDDDDACDSACIGLYGFINEKDKKLKLEE